MRNIGILSDFAGQESGEQDVYHERTVDLGGMYELAKPIFNAEL